MSEHGDQGFGKGPGGDQELPAACAAVDEALGELALGVLTGKERVPVLAHIEGCPRCTAEVAQLSSTVDQLLQLAPAAEPPVGFETRVFERLAATAPAAAPVAVVTPLGERPEPRRPRKARAFPLAAGRLPTWAQAVAAAVVCLALVGAGTLAGSALSSPGHPAASQDALEQVALVSHGKTVGGVMVYAGEPTWLFMYVDAPGLSGDLQCEVKVYDGPTLALGHFWLSGGRGAWAVSSNRPAGSLEEALVVGPHGQVLATAQLS